VAATLDVQVHTEPRWAARRHARDGLYQVTYNLIDEFDGLLPPGTVISQVLHAREHMIGLGVRSGLVPAAEAMARTRLYSLLPPGACNPRSRRPEGNDG
jgi:hypothetical protein